MLSHHSSYAPVSASDNPHSSHDDNRVGLQSHDFAASLRAPPPAYQHMEQARHLTWSDSFYDGKHGIVAAFDRDAVRAGEWLMWRFLRTAIFLWSLSVMYWILGALDWKVNTEESIMDDIFGVYTLILGAFVAIMAWRGRQAMLSQHVAVSSEGIRVDNGTMVTVTVPFEHIQKCDIKPYKFCFQTDEGYYAITVHRAAAPLEQFCCQKTKALELYGILRAQEFVDLVMAMKDAQDQGTYEGLNETTPRLELQAISNPSRASNSTEESTSRTVPDAAV